MSDEHVEAEAAEGDATDDETEPARPPCNHHDVCPRCGGARDLVRVPLEADALGRVVRWGAGSAGAAAHWDPRVWNR